MDVSPGPGLLTLTFFKPGGGSSSGALCLHAVLWSGSWPGRALLPPAWLCRAVRRSSTLGQVRRGWEDLGPLAGSLLQGALNCWSRLAQQHRCPTWYSGRDPREAAGQPWPQCSQRQSEPLLDARWVGPALVSPLVDSPPLEHRGSPAGGRVQSAGLQGTWAWVVGGSSHLPVSGWGKLRLPGRVVGEAGRPQSQSRGWGGGRVGSKAPHRPPRGSLGPLGPEESSLLHARRNGAEGRVGRDITGVGWGRVKGAIAISPHLSR